MNKAESELRKSRYASEHGYDLQIESDGMVREYPTTLPHTVQYAAPVHEYQPQYEYEEEPHRNSGHRQSGPTPVPVLHKPPSNIRHTKDTHLYQKIKR